MGSIVLTKSSLVTLKKALSKKIPEVRSSHLAEALAAALRCRTHASLLAKFSALHNDPPIELLDSDSFARRLQELGYVLDPGFSFELLDNSGVIPTVDPRGRHIKYKSARDKAWRNLVVCGINAGLQQKLFSLRFDDNRWASADKEGCLFDFILPNGLPARGCIYDIKFGELSIHVAVNPKGNWVRAGNAGFAAGDAFAVGWIERERGAWLQSSTTLFNCRRMLLRSLSTISAEPNGYGDRGRVIM